MRVTAARRVRLEPPMPIISHAGILPEGEGEESPIIPPRRTEPIKSRRRLPKVWKIILNGFAIIILTPLAIAIVIGSVKGIAGSASSAPQATHSTDTATFNDGFATSKQDDCAQGFAPACTWLKTNKG